MLQAAARLRARARPYTARPHRVPWKTSCCSACPLFYVGAVLILNGLWMLGRIGDREITDHQPLHRGLTLLVCLPLGADADAASIPRRGLRCCSPSPTCGWPGTASPAPTGAGWAVQPVRGDHRAADRGRHLRAADSTWDWWLGLSWAGGRLWLMFFPAAGLHRPIARATAWMAIVRAWAPPGCLATSAADRRTVLNARRPRDAAALTPRDAAPQNINFIFEVFATLSRRETSP